MDLNWTELASVLIWIVTGGGSGAVAYALWALLEKELPELAEIPARYERFICLGISVVIGVVGFFVQAAMTYQPWPVGAVDWIEQIFSVVALSVLAAQAIHGGRKLATS